MHAMNVVQMSCPFITSLHSVIIIMYPQTIFLDYQTEHEKRRSIRNFNPGKEVSREQIETLIRAASLAPSWKNQQTSRYYCILSPSQIEEFRQI